MTQTVESLSPTTGEAPAESLTAASAVALIAVMSVQQALVDPDPLLRLQAQRQLAYESGELVLEAKKGCTDLAAVLEVAERNRRMIQWHRAGRPAPAERPKKDATARTAEVMDNAREVRAEFTLAT